SGRKLQPGSTRTITFNNFQRNGVKISGTITVAVTDSVKTETDVKITFTHSSELTLTFADQTTFTRNSSITVVWDYIFATPLQSTITHKASTGNASAYGVTRASKPYTMTITKDMIWKAQCF